MKQDTKAAPFNLGDHIRYTAAQKHTSGAGPGSAAELVLVAGMEGVIILSTGALADDSAAAQPWHCRAQFQNGFQIDITPKNFADFEATDTKA